MILSVVREKSDFFPEGMRKPVQEKSDEAERLVRKHRE